MEHSEYASDTKRSVLDSFFAKMRRMRASDAFILKVSLLAFVIFLALFLIGMSRNTTVDIAATGGMFTEGIVGTPRFVNPVLAVTRADKDLSALIYDGLMSLGVDGVLVPSVAESVTVSEDGLTYNVILKKGVRFHDGTELTARDVVFTVGRIQDPLLVSPIRANFDGVTVEEVGDHELNFVLPEPYAPFIENLTFGILPEHIWKDAGVEEFPFSQHNSEPIGAGPYKIKEIVRNASGIPEMYELTSHTEYHGTQPRIEAVRLHFFPTEERLVVAFKEGVIGSLVGISPERLPELGINTDTHHIERIPLPRTFALFVNQNKSAALRDVSARKALEAAIDREALIDNVLGGYGNALTSPVPPGFGVTVETPGTSRSLDAAREILREGGWELNAETTLWEKEIDKTVTPLSFSIATVNNSTFERTAEYLRNTWKELGAEVIVRQFEQADLTQAIIRPRDYESLLFGTQLGRSLDYYSFWHSSQRNDPGLNVSLYANITTDALLSDMRTNRDAAKRTEDIQKLSEELLKETPAIFLYAPELLYVFPNHVKDASFSGVSEPHERFKGIEDWYIETESVWPFFTDN